MPNERPTTRSAQALWFHVETAFREGHELCVQARAAQLVAAQRDPGAKAATPLRSRATLPMEPGAGLHDPGDDDPRLAGAAALARDLAFREANAGGADLVALRAALRKRVLWLRMRLAEVLSDRDVFHGIFPIVVHFDELVRVASRGEAARWEPLQGELYSVDNGGEAFFTLLDDQLRQRETHPLVLEIFFLCLSDGFRGAHDDDPRKLEEYRQRLADRLAVRPVVVDERPAAAKIEIVKFPWPYYAVAVAAVALAHLLFKVLSPGS